MGQKFTLPVHYRCGCLCVPQSVSVLCSTVNPSCPTLSSLRYFHHARIITFSFCIIFLFLAFLFYIFLTVQVFALPSFTFPFFIPPYYYSLQVNGTVCPSKASSTPTLASRLHTLWRHISKSRTHFETTPDTGKTLTPLYH